MPKKCRGSPRANSRARIAQAAELCAGGVSWPAIAKKLGCSLHVCMQWLTKYPDLWAQLSAKAIAERDAAAAAESIRALRAMLRHTEVKVQCEAARELLRILCARDQRQRQFAGQSEQPFGIDDHERLEALLRAATPPETVGDGDTAGTVDVGTA
jgi:transposase